MPQRASRPSIDTPTLQSLAVKYGICHDLELLDSPQGHDNLNFILRADGSRYVLRCYCVTPPTEVSFEINVIRFLVDSGYPTPKVLLTGNGEPLVQVGGYPAALFEFIEGTPLPVNDTESGPKVAAAMGRLHLLTSDQTFGPTRTRTDLNRLLQLESLCSAEPQIAAKPLIAPFRNEICRVAQTFDDMADVDGSLLRAVVHHDMHSDNILVDDKKRIVAVLDFDESYFGPAVIDLASLLLTWGLDDDRASIDVDKSARLIDGYTQQNQPSDADLKALPDAVLLVIASDAAEYLTRGFARDPLLHPEDCHSLIRFFHLVNDPTWRRGLSDALSR